VTQYIFLGVDEKAHALRNAAGRANANTKKKPIRDDDMLRGQFGLDRSPITALVSRPEDLTIDLERPTESPKS
jgi:hypothetical protein